MTDISLRELSWVCKVGIIGGWVIITIYIIAFLYGFLIGLT